MTNFEKTNQLKAVKTTYIMSERMDSKMLSNYEFVIAMTRMMETISEYNKRINTLEALPASEWDNEYVNTIYDELF